VAAPRDLIPGQVQAEDDSSFYVGGGFGRVDVLLGLVGPHRAGGEGKRLGALIPDRDDQPLGEEIGPIAAQEPCLLGVDERAFLRPQVLGKPATGRRVAKLEAARRLLAHPA